MKMNKWGYFGNQNLDVGHERACEVDGQCHPVGSTFGKDCIFYRCDKSDRGHSLWYQPTVTRRLCKDANGHCRHEGENFPYILNGHWYNRCQCIVSGSYTRYSCGS
ncbi:hypothetical protein PoB_007026900 [Plakobranchus ocellatus]|uniref:Uncharacterized protein n=1 Tax=Plakobranchus ocellatus TaxID=259542 RepID=A0AAV4DHV2_9GAST|nr:hypothetical protein PoB_007026900 [Plakobranchus ocellatus]